MKAGSELLRFENRVLLFGVNFVLGLVNRTWKDASGLNFVLGLVNRTWEDASRRPG